jgi:hypothetical protein
LADFVQPAAVVPAAAVPAAVVPAVVAVIAVPVVELVAAVSAIAFDVHAAVGSWDFSSSWPVAATSVSKYWHHCKQ